LSSLSFSNYYYCRSKVAEARREAEEKRDAKYAKMERQREEVRQGIREKVNVILFQVQTKIVSGDVQFSKITFIFCCHESCQTLYI